MILLTYGTRPEYIKIKPLIDVFNENGFEHRVVFTGQHKDLAQFPYDWILDVKDGVNRLDTIIGSIMDQMWECFRFFSPTHVLVQGDTTSVLGIALSTFNHGVKVIHLEAGLRTYDNQNPYPEEQNRRLVSQITDIHLCPTELSKQNLINEKILGHKYVVGNTVLDNLIQYKDKCEYTNKILVTLHRRENHHWMGDWFKIINDLAIKHKEYEFILPIHPNPNVQRHKHLLTHVNVINPLPHDELMNLLVKTRLVITDSGGLQEECSFFNKLCLTCRKVTERPEAMGQSTIMVDNPNDLIGKFSLYHKNNVINFDSPFGDGNAAIKIYDILSNI